MTDRADETPSVTEHTPTFTQGAAQPAVREFVEYHDRKDKIEAGILTGEWRSDVQAQILCLRNMELTLGNVEQLHEYDFEDGSRAWLATATFQPNGEANGIWEQTGIVPDVVVPSRWDLFTEATDPALAKAVELLSK